MWKLLSITIHYYDRNRQQAFLDIAYRFSRANLVRKNLLSVVFITCQKYQIYMTNWWLSPNLPAIHTQRLSSDPYCPLSEQTSQSLITTRCNSCQSAVYLSVYEGADTHLCPHLLRHLSCVKSCSLRKGGESCRALSLLYELPDVSPSLSSPECRTYTCDICTWQDPPQLHVVCGSQYTLLIPVAADRADIFLSYGCRPILTVSPKLWMERSRDLEIQSYATLWGSDGSLRVYWIPL